MLFVGVGVTLPRSTSYGVPLGPHARVQQRGRNLALSPSHSRDLEHRVFFEFSCVNLTFFFLKKGVARDREWPQRNTITS